MNKIKNKLIILSALIGLLGFSSCTSGVEIPETENKPVKEVAGCLETYHPEFAFDADIYKNEVNALIIEKNLDKKDTENKEKSLSDIIVDFVVETATSVYTTQGPVIVKKVKDYLLSTITDATLDAVKTILDTDHNLILKTIFSFNEKGEDSTKKSFKQIYNQILLLSESQDVMNQKLDNMVNILEASQLSSIINRKIEQYNAIQIANEKAYAEIQAIYTAYEDVFNNESSTQAEIDQANEIVTKTVKAILDKWGSQVVCDNSNYLNAAILLKNYQTKWSTGIDSGNDSQKTYIEIYDAIARRIYGWEREGYQFRQMYRTVDSAVLSQAVFLTTMYYKYNNNNDSARSLVAEYEVVKTYLNDNKINFDYDTVTCQIPGLVNKFQAKLWMKCVTDYIDAVNSYDYVHGWFDKVPADKDPCNPETTKRLHFAVKHDESGFKEPKLLSMNDYKKMVDYYENKYTLREIFINYAGFLNAEEIFQTGTTDRSYCLNSNSGNEFRDETLLKGDYIYWAVTDLNKKELPKFNNDWTKDFNEKRDIKFLTHLCIDNRIWGGHYFSGSPVASHNYRVFYPVIIEK